VTALVPAEIGPGSMPQPARNLLFISKATPSDDEFALWLAPRLEAEGYVVFADILNPHHLSVSGGLVVKFHRRHALQLAAGAAALPFAPRFASALDYPNRPVRVLVGYTPGSSPDVEGRLVG
jgi:hypothetical protein